MNIIGLDSLVFGVLDLEACHQYLSDYGLKAVEKTATGGRYEALDGGSIVFKLASDPTLPPANAPAPNLRETVYAVRDQAELERIAAELAKDRAVSRDAEGTIHSIDDCGFAIAFRVNRRRPIDAPRIGINAPGQAHGRDFNECGVATDAQPIIARSLSHVVYYVEDYQQAEAFYTNRLGFRTTDRFVGVGPFMRPKGCEEHHTLFLLQSFNPHMRGVDHFTFHFGSGYEVFKNGWEFAQKGYTSFWGPGRHVMGSNYFWYFNSPFGGTMELDADMDLHDDRWTARALPISSDASQVFLFDKRPKWLPGE